MTARTADLRSRPECRRAAVGCLGAALLACFGVAAPAHASRDQESILQDDPLIVFANSTAELDSTLRRIKSLGTDRIRVSVLWHLVAPRPDDRRMPSFGPGGPAWPGAYPEANWERYDRIVRLATRQGLRLLFTVTGPAPAWAARSFAGKNVSRPSARAFRDFVTAVGLRYSGSYPDPQQPAPEEPATVPPVIEIGPPPAPEPTVQLPRVDEWSIWNEPNFPSWLSPQRTRLSRRRFVPASPKVYRRLVEAGHAGLARSGHGSDRILIGETAPRGGGAHAPSTSKTLMPLAFLRELYCLTPRFRPFGGRAARLRGCPTTARARARFVSGHPGLFDAAGWAHHPYSLNFRPTRDYPAHDVIILGGLRRLEGALGRAFSRWGVGRVPRVYITEYGYETNPPDPFRGVSWSRQAAWTSWAEEIAYRDRHVASFPQFLLADDHPRPGLAPSDPRRWITWQSGLLTEDGREKPSYTEYQHPIRVAPTRTRRGRSIRVFGLYRPAATGVPIRGRIELRGEGGLWEPLRELTVTNPRGYLYVLVPLRSSGSLRIAWTDPASGASVPSRAVRVLAR